MLRKRQILKSIHKDLIEKYNYPTPCDILNIIDESNKIENINIGNAMNV